MSNGTNTPTVAFPFFGILGLIFITLKLTNVITWSWWLVLLPIYGPIILAIGIVLIMLVVFSKHHR